MVTEVGMGDVGMDRAQQTAREDTQEGGKAKRNTRPSLHPTSLGRTGHAARRIQPSWPSWPWLLLAHLALVVALDAGFGGRGEPSAAGWVSEATASGSSLLCLEKSRPTGSVGRPRPRGNSVGRASISAKPECPPDLSPRVVDMPGISS